MIVLRPSQAKRWLTCTASPRFIEEHKAQLDFSAGPAAAEGTEAHRCAEQMALGRKFAWPNAEMRKHVTRFVRLPRPEGTIVEGIEETLPLYYNETDTGTTDRYFASPDTLLIRDLKYGKGVMVDAEENEQLLIYARNAYEDLVRGEMKDHWPKKLKWVIMEIFQPRAQEGDPWKTWKLDIKAFLEKTNIIRRKAHLVQYGIHEEFHPSEAACRFCPAKPICGAHARNTLGLVPIEQKLIVLPKVESLTPDELGAILTARKPFDQWFEAAQAHAVHLFSLGESVPGWMMARGRANRQWKNDKKAAEWMKKRGLEPWEAPKLLSPAKAEEELDVDLPESLVVKPEGKPTLAAANSGRQPELAMADPKRIFTPLLDRATPAPRAKRLEKIISSATSVEKTNKKNTKTDARKKR